MDIRTETGKVGTVVGEVSPKVEEGPSTTTESCPSGVPREVLARTVSGGPS